MLRYGVCNARIKQYIFLEHSVEIHYFATVSGDRYYIQDQHGIHFLTFTAVEWVDFFTRKEYKLIVVDSLNHCIEEKGFECFAWVLMSNHLHIVARANAPFRLSDVVRDMKKFTSKKIVATIETIPESRREWLLHKCEFAAQSTGRAKNYKLWQDSNHAVCLEGNKDWLKQRIDYVHQNPVRQMIVSNAHEYLFSSAGDYAGKQGLVKVTVAY